VCKAKKQIALKRCKHFELGGEKKQGVSYTQLYYVYRKFEININLFFIERRSTMVNELRMCVFVLVKVFFLFFKLIFACLNTRKLLIDSCHFF
jgi:hypothetical protein